MLRSLAEMLARAVDQRIRITVEADETGLTVDVDPGQLESALLNLAVNARDAMPSGGPRILDASTAHRVDPAWAYGFAELTPDQPAAIRRSRRRISCCGSRRSRTRRCRVR